MCVCVSNVQENFVDVSPVQESVDVYIVHGKVFGSHEICESVY